VISGGVIGIFDRASIDKVRGKVLAPKTLYYVYVYKRAGVSRCASTSLDRLSGL
jgi:hypothetical protein